MKVVYDSLLDRIGRVVQHADAEDVSIQQIELSPPEYDQLCEEILNLGLPAWYSKARRFGYTSVEGVHVVKVVK